LHSFEKTYLGKHDSNGLHAKKQLNAQKQAKMVITTCCYCFAPKQDSTLSLLRAF
jgi:hypothetical protein